MDKSMKHGYNLAGDGQESLFSLFPFSLVEHNTQLWETTKLMPKPKPKQQPSLPTMELGAFDLAIPQNTLLHIPPSTLETAFAY
jgi:hypothetical protein